MPLGEFADEKSGEVANGYSPQWRRGRTILTGRNHKTMAKHEAATNGFTQVGCLYEGVEAFWDRLFTVH